MTDATTETPPAEDSALSFLTRIAGLFNDAGMSPGAEDHTARQRLLHLARQRGVKLLPPDVNMSTAECAPEGDAIRLGLFTVRDVGPGTVADIAAGRAGGPYTDFYDFIARVDRRVINRRTLIALARAGAFDSLGHTRLGVADMVADVVEDPTCRRELSTEEWQLTDLLAFERETLGCYVTGHPLDPYDKLIADRNPVDLSMVLDDDPVAQVDCGQTVTVAGVLTDTFRRTTHQGRAWASATLVDRTGEVEVLFFPDVYERAGGWVAEGEIVALRARIDRRDLHTRLMVERLYALTDEIQDPLSGYGPDNWLYSLSDRVARYGTPGSEGREKGSHDESRADLAHLVCDAAQMFLKADPRCDDASRAYGVPDEWLPSRFFASLARRVAGVLWTAYTQRQRELAQEFAARLTYRHMTTWIGQRNVRLAGSARRPAVTGADLNAIPDHVRWHLMTETAHKHEYQRRLTMLHMFLETHTAEEIDQGQLEELLLQVKDPDSSARAFF